jgi:hypothetical protein
MPDASLFSEMQLCGITNLKLLQQMGNSTSNQLRRLCLNLYWFESTPISQMTPKQDAFFTQRDVKSNRNSRSQVAVEKLVKSWLSVRAAH